MAPYKQIPETCVIELVWLPRQTRGQVRTYGRVSQVRTVRFELTLVWSNRKTTQWRRTCRVDAVWPLDGAADMTSRERLDVRDLLDEELRERLPDVLVRPWDSTVIAER